VVARVLVGMVPGRHKACPYGIDGLGVPGRHKACPYGLVSTLSRFARLRSGNARAARQNTRLSPFSAATR
jgi:hypothetical protein